MITHRRHKMEQKKKKYQACDRFPYFHPRVFYHNLFHAILHCGGILAFNGGAIFAHAVDAPRVTLGCLGVAHGTPFNGRGCSGRGLVWKSDVRHNHKPGSAVCLMVCMLTRVFYRLMFTVPLLRERTMLMYSAPKYRKESVFAGRRTSCTVESLNIRFLADG